jgi:hypothetical protein
MKHEVGKSNSDLLLQNQIDKLVQAITNVIESAVGLTNTK